MRTCFVGLIIAAFLILLEQSQCSQTAYAQEHLNGTTINTDINKSVWQRTTADPVALYTLVLSLFTGLLVFVTGGLIWVGYRQILLTKAIADRQTNDTEIIQRAYVNVEPGGLTEHRDRDDRLHTTVIFRNVGHLPARNLRWYGTFGNASDTATDTFPIGALGEGAIVLPPGATSIQHVGTVFTDRLQNSLFVWGIVTYEDGFGKQRFTRFCHLYGTKNIINRLGVNLPAGNARFYEHGNEAD